MAAFCRAAPPERGSAGAQEHTPDRQDRGDDDDDDDDGDDDDDDGDDYNDKRIMVDDGPPRYTGVRPNKGVLTWLYQKENPP
jgi:hypothetical protein